MSFVHLHVHSEYSLLEAQCKIKKIAQKAADYKMPAVALTDNGNLFGAVEFYLACKKNGIQPILGVDAYVAENKVEEKSTKNTRLVFLAKNYRGFQALCRLSTFSYQKGFYYKPRIDLHYLQSMTAEERSDLICLSGAGPNGHIASRFHALGSEAALAEIETLRSLFGDQFYLEITRADQDARTLSYNQFLIDHSKSLNIDLVASNNVHYLNREDQTVQEVLICIGSNKTLQDESRFRLPTDQFYFKNNEEMRALFSDLPEALTNSLKIADACKVEFRLKDAAGKAIYHLPSFPTQEGRSLQLEIQLRAQEGLQLRFEEARRRGEEVDVKLEPAYMDRLMFELSVIQRMGFDGYFLIVQDFINWAKQNGIPVGPGRGSGAGSLVAYSLRITDLDPIQHGLIFERFLNPERVSMPDFDIDFCQEKRGEVIRYVTEKYGAESVSQIITYGKLQARAAIRDVGRVLGMSYAEVDEISKLMPDKLGITLDEALEIEPRLKEQMEINPQVDTLIQLSRGIEGLVRHAGIHAAGVIIADGKLVNHAPLYRGADGENVIQFDMKHAETIGLIKFDFLGLKTLTSIQYTLDLIYQESGKRIRTEDISMLDSGIYEIMSAGDNLGIFQFEGEGISDATRKIKPSSFADITAINALYRPGPMAMIPTYTLRRHGEEKVDYIFPELEEVLKETYGIIIYQEQVQLIAAKIASYSLGEADLLRRAMGKKIKEEMDLQRTRFLSGALQNGHDEKKANELFDLMNKFAEYGFNKSHAAAYCLIAGQTAWLKKYYAPEFYAGLLSTELSNTDNIVKYIKDAQRHKIAIRPPHINYSQFKFTVKDQSLIFGLGAIKGVGEGPVASIVAAQERNNWKPFESLEDFFDKLDTKVVNKKTLECLIKSGALDGFGIHRAQLMFNYPKFLERAERKRKDLELGQTSLFDLEHIDIESERIVLEPTPEWTRMDRLSAEKEVLGFYLSDHPLNGFGTIMQALTTHRLGQLKELAEEIKINPLPERKNGFRKSNRPRVVVGGLVSELKELITKKGTRMAFAKLDDLEMGIELIVFPNTYVDVEQNLKSEGIVLIHGEFESDGESGALKVLVEDVELFADVVGRSVGVELKLNSGVSEEALAELGRILAAAPSGQTQVSLELMLPELGQTVRLKADECQKVHLSGMLIESLHETLSKNGELKVIMQ